MSPPCFYSWTSIYCALQYSRLKQESKRKQNSAQNLVFPNLISIIQRCFLEPHWIFLVLSKLPRSLAGFSCSYQIGGLPLLQLGEICISLPIGARFWKSRSENQCVEIVGDGKFCTRTFQFVLGSYSVLFKVASQPSVFRGSLGACLHFEDLVEKANEPVQHFDEPVNLWKCISNQQDGDYVGLGLC